MNESMAKKTQETLGKVIKKPPLTEKLLSKPPFRFLHDIFTEDKEAKIAFLQKAIDVVIMVTNEPLSVKPGRIVSGHEPEKTNELLQAMGKCCLNKLSSEDAVQRVLAGEKLDLKGKHPSTSKSQDKENRETKEEDKKRHKDKEESRDTEIKERSTSRDRKVEQPKETEAKKNVKGRHKDDERQEKGRDRERTKERDREKEKSRDRDKEKGREKEKDRDKGKERERDREKRREHPKEPEEKAKELEEKAERKHESPARIPRPSSAKGQRRRPKPGGQVFSDSRFSIVKAYDCNVSPCRSPNNACVSVFWCIRRIPRPSSARPAPPRVKRQDSADVLSVERIGSGKPLTAVIVDGKKDSDDEDNDELFVVEEAAPLLPDLPKMEMEPAVELKEDDKHGGLVKKILETKKDYEALQPSSKTKDQDKTIVSEATKRKERDLVSRETEKLRSSIQTVCRSALPLGKIMDYIQEDMDSMKKELQMWRSENAEHAAALIKEQRRINEKSVWCCGWLPCTPLRIAATAGHGNCVSFLIREGAEVDLVDVKGQTALYVAVVNGHLSCVRILLEAGADPNGSRHHRSTPVYHAARVGRVDILQELIRFGANVDVEQQLTVHHLLPNVRRFTSLVVCPLYISAAYHHLHSFQLLMQAGANPDYNYWGPVSSEAFSRGSPTCMLDAVLRHDCEPAFVMLLIDCGANLNLVKWEALDPEIMGRVKVNHDALQLFREARSMFGANVDVEQQLTVHHLLPNVRRFTSLVVCPLYISAAYHHLHSFQLLMQAGANPDYNYWGPVSSEAFSRGSPTCMLDAVLRHDCEPAFVMLLIDCGANLNLVKWEALDPEIMGRVKVNHDALQLFREARSSPRTLTSLCRITIRRVLGKQRLKDIQSLPVPHSIKIFLLHKNL
ncbi:UNVERIFIED_CONTAM: hypothetical protein FKN15_032118 [Acipenser sinensis]